MSLEEFIKLFMAADEETQKVITELLNKSEQSEQEQSENE